MCADQGCGCLLHGFQMQRPAAIPCVTCDVGQADALFAAAGCASRKDSVFVGFVEDVGASVEVGWRGFAGENADGGGKSSIQRAVEAVCGDVGLQCEGDGLTDGMNAGVGAAGTLWKGFFTDGFADDFRQGALNGSQFGLDLPSEKIRAIVRQREPECVSCGVRLGCGIGHGKRGRGNIADVSNVPCTTMPCGVAGGCYTLTSEGNTGAYVACERSDGAIEPIELI